MADDIPSQPPPTRVYLTGCALTHGVIEEAWGRIDGVEHNGMPEAYRAL